MTRITIETDIDGCKDTQKVVIDRSKTAVTIDEMVEMFEHALRGMGFFFEKIEVEVGGE